ncbi:hypothetical protein F5141DRAFT_1060829 [Pisolithus sp. B1]|nr:hypothetical protein F5141DRAFT_1060829 [Pisolithus sp. B1]
MSQNLQHQQPTSRATPPAICADIGSGDSGHAVYLGNPGGWVTGGAGEFWGLWVVWETSENHGQLWATGKLFPWKQLLQKLGHNALVCVNWPDAVLFLDKSTHHVASLKPYKTMDHIGYTLSLIQTTKMSGNNSIPLDLLTSKRLVIIGAPPLHDSKSPKAKRIFYNGKTNYDGPACLPNPAMTQIERQVGGGKSTNRNPKDDEHSSLSPSPAPRTLCSMLHKGAVKKQHLSVKGTPKSTNGHKKVEVVITTMANKVGKWPPSIITVRDSSEPGEQRRSVPKKRLWIISSFDSNFSSDKRLPATIMTGDSSAKQLTTPLEIDTTQHSSPKVVKNSSQSRPALKQTRLQFIPPLSSEELETHPLGDELNAMPSQPSEKLCAKQLIHSQQSSSRIQEDQQGSIVSQEPGSDWLPSVQNQEPPHLEALCKSHPDQSPSVPHQELPAPDIQQGNVQLLFMILIRNDNKAIPSKY